VRRAGTRPDRGRRGLTHLDAAGHAHVVDVGDKAETARLAVARAEVAMAAATARLIARGGAAKGDVLGAARLAGLMAVKRTAELIPLCHPLRVTHAAVELTVVLRPRPRVEIRAEVRGVDRSGFEMEALTAAAVAALTVYDMCKAVDRGMRISTRLEAKAGGRSGAWTRRGGAGRGQP
jgi:cyclic pyranopterin phosphate synthase